ncbi:MAG: LLM class flavin-dependent oxidoreductase [Dehalococcoidia bacterium]|nr:LLM class flavin-dependent oxidoreductase [Dehalococcoidia bacterium]MSQ16334.1 LLM class flavin-dependent oxidoreductase [Dehalococcoidia bacterium]
MNFGAFLDFATRQGGTQASSFREAFDMVDLAEETGLDTIWLGETHFNANRPISAPLVVASAIATRTKRLRVGMAVQVLPLISPLRIAEEAATVDQISQGRFEMGVGRSGNVRAYEAMGIPYEESRERFQEALDIILEAWKGKPFSYQGQFNQIDNATVTPEPFHKPHPPIRLASTGEDSFARVGRLGFPIFLSMRGMDVNDLERNMKEYHRAWRAAGHPGNGGDISVRIPMYLSTTEEGAVEEARETIEAFFTRMRQRYEQGRDEEGAGGTAAERAAALKKRAERLAQMTYEEILETRVICGTPENVIDRLKQFQEKLGLTGFAAELNPGGLLPPEAVQRSMRLLTDEVMPAFK